MKYIKYIGAFVLLFIVIKCLSSSPEEENSIHKIDTNTDQWYIGGSLHKSKVSEWKVATEENKLATCGDFIANITKDLSTTELKIKASELKTCIDEATAGKNTTNEEKVIDIAGLCVIQLGY
jgi:hypothetical protein